MSTSNILLANSDPVDLVDRIEVLFNNESLWYKTENYLVRSSDSERNETKPPSPHSSSIFNAVFAPPDPFKKLASSSTTETMTYAWRERMCEWAYQLVDHFDFSRDIVSISMNFMDRYLSATSEKFNKKSFQLLSMTCLYLAIKLNQPLYHDKVLTMDSMIKLSRGFFTKEQMQEAEMHIFYKLEWHLHPTTPLVFLRHYLQVLQPDRRVHHQMLDLGRFFIELSVLDYFFVSHRPSAIAMAALLSAMEQIPECNYQDGKALWRSLIDESRLQPEEIMQCKERLLQLYLPNARAASVHAAEDDAHTVTPERQNKIRRTTSPVSVAHNINTTPVVTRAV